MKRNVAKKVVGLVLAGLIVGSGAYVMVTYPGFQAEMQDARSSLQANGAMIETAAGTLEYAESGVGPPVLIVHGAGGGYDQGLFIGNIFIGPDFRVVAPSRFGYLRSPVPTDSSPAAQADAYAALLDALQIEKVAVVGFSDGGPSALQFALRHPNRCAALVMMAAKSSTPPPENAVQAITFRTIFRSDYLYWWITEQTKPFLLTMYGVPAEVQSNFSAAEIESVNRFLDSMHPMSLRKAGIYNDRATLAELPASVFPLEQITPPILIVHAKDDSLQHFAHAQYLVEHNLGAELAAFESGGHLLLGHQEEVRQVVARFFDRHLAVAAGQTASIR